MPKSPKNADAIVVGHTDAGIIQTAKPWSLFTIVFGTLAGILFGALVCLPLVLFMLMQTLFDTLCWLSDTQKEHYPGSIAGDNEVVLVLPGTCSYAFWQFGMLQYICEHYDTRGARIAGVSSGAIGAAFVLLLEDAAEKAENKADAVRRIRTCAQDLFRRGEQELAMVCTWPLGFLGRLGRILDCMVEQVVTPEKFDGSRLRIGVRRFVAGPFPSLVPDSISNFCSPAELKAAVRASSVVWMVVRLAPVLYLPQMASFCADGVNALSFFLFVEYWSQWRRGIAHRTLPPHTHSGGLDMIYPLWNCGVMATLLPRGGRHLWVCPTMGGRLQVRHFLHFSAWFAGEQWQQGYAHAAQLDSEGYWSAALPRRTS